MSWVFHNAFADQDFLARNVKLTSAPTFVSTAVLASAMSRRRLACAQLVTLANGVKWICVAQIRHNADEAVRQHQPNLPPMNLAVT